ncbi:hypothetical protein D3C76_1498680 [compost metagenome]
MTIQLNLLEWFNRRKDCKIFGAPSLCALFFHNFTSFIVQMPGKTSLRLTLKVKGVLGSANSEFLALC